MFIYFNTFWYILTYFDIFLYKIAIYWFLRPGGPAEEEAAAAPEGGGADGGTGRAGAPAFALDSADPSAASGGDKPGSKYVDFLHLIGNQKRIKSNHI